MYRVLVALVVQDVGLRLRVGGLIAYRVYIFKALELEKRIRMSRVVQPVHQLVGHDERQSQVLPTSSIRSPDHRDVHIVQILRMNLNSVRISFPVFSGIMGLGFRV